jgi:hypothetical protein
MRPLPTILLVAIATLTAGCGLETGSRWGEDWPAPADRLMRPDHAPTPYTAAQIRTACRHGRRSTFLTEAPGNQPSSMTFTFLDPTDDGCTLEISGSATRRVPATWKGFQAHASFPDSQTRISRETIEVPAGRYHCMHYTVTGPAGAKDNVTDLWFAHELPGPPVLREVRESGQVVSRMVLVEHEASQREGE